jgi:hypothetical protein
MTRNFKIAEIDSPHYFKLGIKEVPDTFKAAVDWVSHGRFAIRGNDQYVGLEYHFFDDILNAYEKASTPSGRVPFWKGNYGPLYTTTGINEIIEVYACNTPKNGHNYIKIITSSCSSVLGGTGVPHYHSQFLLSVETFRKLRDAANKYLEKRGYFNAAAATEDIKIELKLNAQDPGTPSCTKIVPCEGAEFLGI